MQPALDAEQYLRSIDASRDSLGKARTKLLDVIHHVQVLTDSAPYAVVGGLAQILWARKTHTDGLDVALAAMDLHSALQRVKARRSEGVAFTHTARSRARAR
jgi:hypothetical protein